MLAVAEVLGSSTKEIMKIKTKLYGGKVKLLLDTFGHKYTVNGKKVTSVTQALNIIAKPALINWAANTAIDYVSEQIDPGEKYDEIELATIWKAGKRAHWMKKTDAGTIGTLVHKWVEDYINGKNPGMPVNEDLKKAVKRFMGWVKEHKVEFLLSEQQIYSRKYNYTGTLDFICKIDGKMYIGDLKTSKAIYKMDQGAQLSAYRMAREEEYPEEDYAGCILVRVGKKDGEFETWQFNDDTVFRHAFLYALKLHGKTEEVKVLEKSGKLK